jgi:hypothetical protein
MTLLLLFEAITFDLPESLYKEVAGSFNIVATFILLVYVTKISRLPG